MNIPDAPYYVLSNDTFMSGWGCASGKINTLILPCDSWEEANTVATNAKTRKEQKYVRIVDKKPRLRHATHVYSVHTREEYWGWYTPGWFTLYRRHMEGPIEGPRDY